MALRVVLFEDEFFDSLLPLVYFRPVYNLRCGIYSLREKLCSAFQKHPVSLLCRSVIADVQRERRPKFLINEINGDKILFVNGSLLRDHLFEKNFPKKIIEGKVFFSGGRVAAACISGAQLDLIRKERGDILRSELFDGNSREEIDLTFIRYPWQLVHQNAAGIRIDFSSIKNSLHGRTITGTVKKGAVLVNRKEIIIEKGAVIHPGVVLDASNGPVYIGRDAEVMAHSAIIGPAAVCDHAVIKIGSKIYEGTTIGPTSKAGGEIAASILHGFASKQHDGFLGHAYLGAWVNLGAGTSNSNLKNNYSMVKMTVNGLEVETGEQFCGVMIGDHTKTAINTIFNTGTVAGVAGNIFGSGFPPKCIPSFTWGGCSGESAVYDVDKAIGVAKKVMMRRHIEMTEAEVLLFKQIFELTKNERLNYGTGLQQ